MIEPVPDDLADKLGGPDGSEEMEHADEEREAARAEMDGLIAGQSSMDLGAVDETDEVDLRDIVMLHQVEERKSARERARHILDLVASLGGDLGDSGGNGRRRRGRLCC